MLIGDVLCMNEKFLCQSMTMIQFFFLIYQDSTQSYIVA